MAPKILMIVTSSSRMGNTDKPTGLWAEELAVPYYALVDAGASVVVAQLPVAKRRSMPAVLKLKGRTIPMLNVCWLMTRCWLRSKGHSLSAS